MCDEAGKFSINLSFIGTSANEKYVDALGDALTLLDIIFDKLDLEEKIEKLIDLLADPNRNIRLGALVGLALIIKKFKIKQNIKLMIAETVVSLLESYEMHEELFLTLSLEILSNLLKSIVVTIRLNKGALFSHLNVPYRPQFSNTSEDSFLLHHEAGVRRN